MIFEFAQLNHLNHHFAFAIHSSFYWIHQVFDWQFLIVFVILTIHQE